MKSTSCNKRKSPSPSSKLTLVSFSFAKSDGGIPVDFDLYYDLRDIKSTAWKIPGYHCKSGCDTSISSAVFQEESAILHYNQICTALENNTANKVAIGYIANKEVQITGASNLTAADVFTVVKAIDVMEGATGPAPLVELSSKVTATDIEALT